MQAKIGIAQLMKKINGKDSIFLSISVKIIININSIKNISIDENLKLIKSNFLNKNIFSTYFLSLKITCL